MEKREDGARTMQILMFGWEFPPYISGGLGTACYGMTKALVARGHRVTFVVPSLPGPDRPSHVALVAAADFPAGPEKVLPAEKSEAATSATCDGRPGPGREGTTKVTR